MAYELMIPYKCSAMSTGSIVLETSSTGGYWKKLTTSGVYLKTGGTSRIDPTKFIFLVSRNSSDASTDGRLTVICGSTDGKSDFQPGGYDTLNNHNITIAKTTQFPHGVSGQKTVQMIFIPEAAKFLDTYNYLKLVGDTILSSIANAACSLGTKIAAIYLKTKGH